MPADEVHHEDSAQESRARTGPRHAAPRTKLFTRLHMPAGKAIAIAAMPTAVLMGLGMTPTLAMAKDNPSNFSADDYKACADAVKTQDSTTKDKSSAEASPSRSASASAETSGADKGTSSKSGTDGKKSATPTPSPSATSGSSGGSGTSSGTSSGSGDSGTATASPSPSPSKSSNPLDPLGLGSALNSLLGGGDTSSPSPSPSPSASTTSQDSGGTLKDTTDKLTDTVKGTTDKATSTLKDTTGKATDAAKKATDTAKDAATKATGAATPSPSSSGVPDNCPVATDKAGGYEDTPAPLPDKSWKLRASSLLLKGADYQGLVDVRMADGTTKRVMKYVISDGTDIGDLHQIVAGPDGKYFHIRAAKGSTSTIRGGKTVMYTEELSGNLFGLIPMTFNAKNPPPLNLPILYFTNVRVTQASQFGGNLHVPGLHTTVEDTE
ncbi:hypothetical protein [Streptomyces beihaiensis]|uniref:Membrane-bound hydrophilic protein n=1 Tax=Streptomyces beihaiensis TaxID=2984495 RepID=A0ABT3U4L7_9ACTN|nr:hypothetical protein [Streptomyces beihaiensis]MCX3063586.1 hypothetical protein [Streptomyces beihaiensis]